MEKPDLSYLNSLSGGDKSFENKILEVIREEFPGELNEYTENVKNQKLILAAENVHKIKHKISILGLKETYGLAVKHEDLLKVSNTSLVEEFGAALNILTDYINKI
jgi:HPt (histidine-containing phosphotransfer) domain-containing protein